MSPASTSSSARLERLPAAICARLDELRATLQSALGDDLVALIVYGSAARGDYREGKSDVDLVVVLKNAERDALDAISNALQLARYSARIEAMILTAAEIQRAADVFPLLYDDIRREHILLAGKDPFSALEISDRHRRLRVEQELREAQIRLRRAVVDAQGARDLLAGAVFRKVRQLRGPLRALLSLRGVEVGDALDDVLARAGAQYGVETKPLFAVHAAPAEAHAALEKLLAAAVDDVDRMEEGGAA
jgi:predicted nucleotidyltransferase